MTNLPAIVKAFEETFVMLRHDINFMPLDSDKLGRCDVLYTKSGTPACALIYVDSTMESDMQAMVLIHEMTHAVEAVVRAADTEKNDHPEIFFDICNAFTLYAIENDWIK